MTSRSATTLVLLFSLALFLGTSSAQWDKPSWCKERDCPRFELVNDADGFQTRKYASALWAHVHHENVEDPAEVMMKSFAMLFEYFNGGNDKQEIMPMTVPVAHNITMRFSKDKKKLHECGFLQSLKHGLGLDKHKKHCHHKIEHVHVKFYLPYVYQEGSENRANPPKPNSKEVSVDSFPEFTSHVRSFEGFPTPLKFMEHFEALTDRLDKDGEDFSTEWAVFSVYNSPTELEDRHNEVLLPAWGGKHKKDNMKHGGVAHT